MENIKENIRTWSDTIELTDLVALKRHWELSYRLHTSR